LTCFRAALKFVTAADIAFKGFAPDHGFRAERQDCGCQFQKRFRKNIVRENSRTARARKLMKNLLIYFGFAMASVVVPVFGSKATAAETNAPASEPTSAFLQQIKTVFVIPLENHDLTQRVPDANPQQLLGNPAAPYLNSLITSGNSNSVQVSYATRYYSVCHGAHPSEMNYVWSEAGTSFGVFTDNDPGTNNTFTCQHLTGQMDAAGISWKSYQEDLEYTSRATISRTGLNGRTNVYNGTTHFSYTVKHNPMQFFTDTQNRNVHPLTNFWQDLAENKLGRYNWVTPNSFNEMHSRLPEGFLYQGTLFSGNQAAIAQGDNFLSIVIPKIMASKAYQDNGVILIWMDETVSTDDTNTTLPFVVISPLAKGNAYASEVVYSHSSTLKTMDEIFGLAFQTNAIPAAGRNAFGTGYNDVVTASDLRDMFQTSKESPGKLRKLRGDTL
jgi:hypothetical protein